MLSVVTSQWTKLISPIARTRDGVELFARVRASVLLFAAPLVALGVVATFASGSPSGEPSWGRDESRSGRAGPSSVESCTQRLMPAFMPELVPAYSHNDYHRDHPLSDALEYGCVGVEVDYFLVDGELRVGHARDELVPGRTLESVYLAPLADRVLRLGSVYGDGTTFLLNIEAKASGAESYPALHAALEAYSFLFERVERGEFVKGPVRVVLVGDLPDLDLLSRQPTRYAGVHALWHDPLARSRRFADLVRMISVDYRRVLVWDGWGRPPEEFRRELAEIVQLRDAVPGRVLRCYDVPRSRRVYGALLDAGVDLIGTKTLRDSRDMLTDWTRTHPDWAESPHQAND